jgi:two-component system, NarL family, response regulator DevR
MALAHIVGRREADRDMDQQDDRPIRVMVVDDYELVRSGIAALIDGAAGMEVVDEAGTASDAVRNALKSHPDVIVMDVRLGDGSGIEATREIRAELPETKVLMLTSFNDDQALFSAMMAGAAGYLLKQLRGDEIVSAIRKVGSGLNLMDPARTQPVLARLRRGKHMNGDERLGRLSAQEERVVLLVAEGCTNREIGERLSLAEKTVKNYVSSVLRKLEVERRAEAAAYLVRHTQPEG